MITDLNAAITPLTTRCVAISPNSVRCVIPERIEVWTKDGADSVDVVSHDAVIHGGPGPDTLSGTRDLVLFGGGGDDRLVGRSGEQALYGGAGADSLNGGLDRDRLVGGAGADSLDGGRSWDVLEGDAGTDVIAGGPGGDTVTYEDHRAPVWISLDGRANDGAAGENDWIRAMLKAPTEAGVGQPSSEMLVRKERRLGAALATRAEGDSARLCRGQPSQGN